MQVLHAGCPYEPRLRESCPGSDPGRGRKEPCSFGHRGQESRRRSANRSALSAHVANGTLAAPNGPGGFPMSVAVARYQNFVGGEWLDAVEGDTTEIINPATGETIGEVPEGSEADVDRAVQAAKK